MTLNLLGAGMVTPVGFSAPASCAAIRAGLDGIRQTRFKFRDKWLKGGLVTFPDGALGIEKLALMARMAIDECLTPLRPGASQETALLFCTAERERVGRVGAQGGLFDELVGVQPRASRFHPSSRLFEAGTTGAVSALELASQLIAHAEVRYAVVAGVDSFLTAGTLRAYHDADRLLTEDNMDGMIPGEAAAAVLVARRSDQPGAVQCLGIGWGREEALPGTDRPLRGDGLTQAYKAVMADAGLGYESLDYRLTGIGGTHREFKEAALALARTMRTNRAEFEIEHPADCIGSVGAATVPLLLGMALAAARRGYAPGPGVLCHCGDDNGLRAAIILRQRESNT